MTARDEVEGLFHFDDENGLEEATIRFVQLLQRYHGPEPRYDIPKNLREYEQSSTRPGPVRIPWRPSILGSSG
jgi:hypothetical protein